MEFDGDVEEVFQRTFEIEVANVMGVMEKHELKEQGKLINLTNENAPGNGVDVEFIGLYANYILNNAVESAFDAFQEGFDMIMQGSALVLFRPEELMEAICGSHSLDFQELEKSTKYDGFEVNDPVIRLFH